MNTCSSCSAHPVCKYCVEDPVCAEVQKLVEELKHSQNKQSTPCQCNAEKHLEYRNSGYRDAMLEVRKHLVELVKNIDSIIDQPGTR